MKAYSHILISLLGLLSLTNALPDLAVGAQKLMTSGWFFGAQIPPSGWDFWRQAQELGAQAIDYANKELNKTASRYADVSERVQEFKASVIDLAKSADDFRVQSQTFQIVSFNRTEFMAKLSEEIEVVIEQLKVELSQPLPEDQSERYKQREVAVSRALDKIEGALVKVYRMFGIPELDVREKFSHVKPHIKKVVLITGNLADKHPEMVEVLIITAVIIIIPEGWILRPLLRVFGFGPQGPVKGSVAAWAQRYFYGAIVKEASWFSRLQAAGMKWQGIGFGSWIWRCILGLFMWA